MPRGARLDAPGTLHHVIVRGIERLINRQMLSQDNVDQIYAHQRGFLGLVGSSSPLFLVNGNHEQAARYLLHDLATASRA